MIKIYTDVAPDGIKVGGMKGDGSVVRITIWTDAQGSLEFISQLASIFQSTDEKIKSIAPQILLNAYKILLKLDGYKADEVTEMKTLFVGGQVPGASALLVESWGDDKVPGGVKV